MDETTLLLEVGAEALDELSTTEKNAILMRYSNSQVKFAGMKVFDILRKKFMPNYKMGRMYESLSQKFEKYEKLYVQYAKTVRAGKLGNTDFGDKKVLESDKFQQTHNKLDDV